MAAYYPQSITSIKLFYRSVPELAGFFLDDVKRTGKRLGHGSFGVVEEVTVGGTLYAGKKLHSTLLDSHNEGVHRIIERFITECKLMSKLRHPNIVQFIGLCFFDESIHPILVMEKVDINFESLLKTHKNLPFPLVLHILQDIARGLICLHGQKPPIIHRDLTARNVLINRASMNAKIADLGNALMVDPQELSNTLSQAPGTLPYMPPEALNYKPKYDCLLDMFSFGHLALYAVIHEFPGDLLPSTYSIPQTEELIARTEVARREKYIRKLSATLSNDHAVTKLILRCLSNMPGKRPTSTEVLQQLGTIFAEDDPYIQIDLVELINRADEQASRTDLSSSLSQLQIESESSLKRHVLELKSGVPGLLEIYRSHGKAGFGSRRQSWKKQVFQIKNDCLMYFKTSQMDRSYNDSELPLSKVVCVKACPPPKDKTLFYFEVHFTEQRGSPWSLGVYRQDDRTCWMEAICPGSSEKLNLSRSNSYKRLSTVSEYDDVVVQSDCIHTTANEAYSFVPPPTGPIYEEPYIPTQKRLPPSSQQPKFARPEELCSYYEEPAVVDKQATPLPPVPKQRKASGSSVTNTYELKPTVKAEEKRNSATELDDMYVYVESTDSSTTERAKSPLPFHKSETFPKKLDTLTEISLENVSNLNSSEVQLWMILQMQKMVQKMGTVRDGEAKEMSGSPSEGKLTANLPSHPTPPPYPPPPDKIEEIYDQYISDNDDVIDVPDPKFQNRAYSCKVKKSKQQEQTAFGGNEYQEQLHRSNTDVFTSGSITSANARAAAQKSRANAGRGRPPLRPKPDPSVVYQRVKESIPADIRQRRQTTHQEMMSTLKARNRTISSEISSHLIVGDGGTAHITGKQSKRPEWAKAKTQSPHLESPLADLKQKALFLSRSDLSQKWEEIGRGQYGMVFKGVLKRAGLPVAIKTIKQYESDKEKSTFHKEMMVMSRLVHPNIVHLFGLVEAGNNEVDIGPPLIVLEYLPHGDLKTFLTNNKQPVKKLIKYMLDVATGMHYITELGLVHRDLAARNVMVSESEICKVGDFGLLRELPKDIKVYVATTKVPFPIRWMAPECHLKNEFSPATDVWSFGIVQWEMHNPSETPYKDMDHNQVVANVCTGTRLPIPEVYPETVEKIMKACWQSEPSERPSFLLIAMLLSNVVFGTD